MKTISGIGDTLDVFAVHGVGGTIGVLLTGVVCSLRVNDAGHDGLGIDFLLILFYTLAVLTLLST